MSMVVIKNCPDYTSTMMTNLMKVDLQAGAGSLLLMKVLLKVNLIGPKPSDSAAITHAEFVRALLNAQGPSLHRGSVTAPRTIAGIAPTAREPGDLGIAGSS